MRRRLSALLIAFLLPIATIVALPSPAHAATYCYTVIAFTPGGWLSGDGIVDNCIQPITAEIHLREDIPWSPDREVSADYRYNVTAAHMIAVAFNCMPTFGEWHDYFLETRVKVGGSYQQKQQSGRWSIQSYCY